jgi:hypothetical protein
MNECCENVENREDGPGPNGGEFASEITVTHCTVCKRRHFEVEAEPGLLGVLGSGL